MNTTDTSEGGLEALIVRHLVEANGYEQGTNADYDREYAIDEAHSGQNGLTSAKMNIALTGGDE